MQIIDYFQDNRRAHWLDQLRQVEWRAARLLEQLLTDGTFHQLLGRGTLFLLTDGDALVSFLTLAERDCIDDASLAPWIGFVHTSPAYRGRRCAGRLLEHAVRVAGEYGAKQVYICTDHAGLYEKYGFTYLTNRISIYGEDSRVLVRRTTPPEIRVEPMREPDFHAHSLDGFVRRQEVRRCWRQTETGWQLQPIAFVEDWDAARLREEAAELLDASRAGDSVFIAWAGQTVIGFAALGGRLGSRGQYIELRSLHVSQPWRNRGAGSRLFAAACDAARAAGAEKLYISAHSSEESQAAYRALGCVHAEEPDAAHVSAEPCDVQLEYDLHPQVTIRFGEAADLPQWMALVRRVAWNFPGLETESALLEHEATVAKFIRKGNAICAMADSRMAGVLLFSRRLNQLCCMAVAPEYRRLGLASGMLRLMDTIADPARDVRVVTFREGDPLGAAARAFYAANGFVPAEMTTDNGHPCQVFVRRAAHAKGEDHIPQRRDLLR